MIMMSSGGYSEILDSLIKSCKEFDLNNGNGNENSNNNDRRVVFELLIDGYKKKGLFDEAVSFFLGAKRNGFVVGLLCCNGLLSDLLKANKLELFWRFYNGMLEANVLHDVYTYTHLINAHFRAGNAKEGKRLLFEMKEKGSSPSLVTYNVVIGGLCRAGEVDEAFELKKLMDKKGLVADVFTYSILIDGFGKQKRCTEAKLMLEEMFSKGLKPDHVAYTALIDGFMRQGDSGEAFRVKEEMLARGVKLNLFTYNALVKGVCKFGDMEKANALLNEMIMVGIKPDTQTYNNMIEGYLKEQNTSRVKDLLSEMKKRNLVPTAYTCGMIINGLCRHGSIEDASRVFEIMVSLGVKPNAVIYTTLIKGFLKEAEQFFVDMQKRNLMPNTLTYTALLSGYNMAGRRSEMFALFEEMIAKDIEPDGVTWSVMIDAHLKEGDYVKTLKLVDDMLNKGGKMDGAARVLKSMVRFKWVPDSTELNDLINVEQDSTDSEYAGDFLKQMAWEVASQFHGIMNLSNIFQELSDGLRQQRLPKQGFGWRVWRERNANYRHHRGTLNTSGIATVFHEDKAAKIHAETLPDLFIMNNATGSCLNLEDRPQTLARGTFSRQITNVLSKCDDTLKPSFGGRTTGNHKDQHCSYVDSAIDATTKHSGRKWPRDLQPNQRHYIKLSTLEVTKQDTENYPNLWFNCRKLFFGGTGRP
ncbi:hypothetical protein D5086_027266 [Populus alba]|uniref:Uncharacterized protein n=1 Tax=Populus alba TaxID=43335 RepID=A0ACC4AUX4_POPAL